MHHLLQNSFSIIECNTTKSSNFSSKFTELKKNKQLYEMCVKRTEVVIKIMLELYEPLRGMNLDDLSKKMKKYYLGDKEHYTEEEVSIICDIINFIV